MKRKEKSSPESVGDIVKSVFKDLEREKDLTKEEIEERWKKIAGEAAFKHTRPVALRKSTLTVFVDSSTWMQEMRFRKRGVLKQLKSTFGKDKISGIQFRIGEI